MIQINAHYRVFIKYDKKPKLIKKVEPTEKIQDKQTEKHLYG